MTKEQIISQTNAFLIGTLDFDPAMITPDTELRRDLGITSVDAVAIASFVQKTFGCAISKRPLAALLSFRKSRPSLPSRTSTTTSKKIADH